MRFDHSGRRFSRRTLVVLAAVLPAVTGCDLDTVLRAEDPFTVTPDVARDTANIGSLFAGVRSHLAAAFGGIQNREGGIVIMSGLMSDELISTDNFTDRRAVDRRDIDYVISNAASDHAFIYLQRARVEALNAIDLYEQSPRAGGAEHAELYSIAGYSIVMLAENFCTGIPLSRITDGGIEYGQPLSAEELYDAAISYFDQALALPNAGARQRNLARMGKARALLDLGEFDAAAAVASEVPGSFGSFDVEYAIGGFETPNPVYNFNNEERRVSVANNEGLRGLPYRTVAQTDPRIQVDPNPYNSNSGAVQAYLQLKYANSNAGIPLASAIEARLIEAEAALEMGQSSAYLAHLNSLRNGIGLSPLTDPGSPTARVDQFFTERAYWLWLTGHRLSDLRRLVRQYNRDQASVFPVGVTEYNLSYGDAVSLPIPYEETNNPHYPAQGCTNTGA